jgi:hypothetical protein
MEAEFKNMTRRCGLDSIKLMIKTSGWLCKDSNELSGSVKGGEFLHQLSDYELLKKKYALWSELLISAASFPMSQSLLSNGHRGLFLRGQSGRGVKQITQFLLAPMLTIRTAISPHLYAFKTWCLIRVRDVIFIYIHVIRH